MISLVSTVFNDRKGLEIFIQSMLLQTMKPDEIVIVDAGSKDGTWELLQEESARTDRPWSLRALQEARCNVARGRDQAIAASSGDIIVSTDIGCDWDPEWLAELVHPLLEDSALELVNGSWDVRKDGLHGPWALAEWALKGDQKFEGTADCYPSSRSIAYRRNVWKALGGYPEDLTLAGDDAVFDFLIEKAEVHRVGAPVVRCHWHRHESLRAFFRESWRYGLGDGEALIRLRDVALIGGRLAFDIMSLISGIVLVASANSIAVPVGGFLLLCCAISTGIRILRLRPARRRLAGEGVRYPMGRLLLLSYGTKVFWLRGYLMGVIRGRRNCRSCRHRLRTMTPRVYRESMKRD
mgnify:CR=1 FL=1